MSLPLRSELTKVTSTRLWWGLLLGVVCYSAVSAAAAAAFAGVEAGPGRPATPGLGTAAALRGVYAGAAFAGGYLFALVLGITGMTGEHRYGTASSTYLTTPRRPQVVLAKAGAHLLVGTAYGVAALVSAVMAGGVVVLIRGFELGLGAPGLLRAALLAVPAVALWTLIGLGVGTLVRNQVAALLLGVAVALLVEPLATLGLGALDADRWARFLPGSASSAMTSPPAVVVDLLPWWGGALTLLAYALAFTGLGVLLTVRRDVP